MNPENAGEHIALRHSTLWKKPLVYEKQAKQQKGSQYPQEQMN